MNRQRKASMIQPGQGKDLHLFGDVVSVLVPGEQTEARLVVLFDTTPPAGGPPPHVHANEDELFLVVEGRIHYFADGQWTEVGPGGAVYLPRGTVHYFRNGPSIVSLQDSDNFTQGGRYANDVQTTRLGWSNPVGVCDFLWCDL